MKSKTINITEGTIWKQILEFFFPILLGIFFQQLYNTADAVIVGRLLGPQALVAVGGGSATAINLLIGFFVGLSSGAGVIISQFYGAGDNDNVHKAVHNAFALALLGGLLISVAGFLCTGPLLRILKTPEDVMPLAFRYMRIYFSGSVVVIMYNIGSGIFRAVGDSRSPLLFLIAGCLVNILLDILFVGLLKMGVDGAAVATLISQFVSFAMVVYKLTKRNDSCKLRLREIRFDRIILSKTIRIGIPAGIQSIMYSLSNLLIHSSVNSFGTTISAAWSAYGKLDAFFWMIINAYGISITTFVGQNYGAGKTDRSRKGVSTCLILTFASTVILEVAYLVFGKAGLTLFTKDPGVIDAGWMMIKTIVPLFFTYVCVEILSGAIRGTGKALIPTLISALGICGLRVLWLIIIPKISNYGSDINAIIFCYPVTWTVTSLLFIFYYKFGQIYDVHTTHR